MAFNEKIKVTIDVVTDKATAGFKDFKSKVGDAEGGVGKLKAGVGSLGDTFRGVTASPALLAGGITAAAGVALSAATDFADLGVTIGKFADATGLATEDASRMVEVAGDLGIGTDTLQSTLGKLNKNINPKLFKDLGIEIATTASGATDVNGTFLNVIDKLNGITDESQKAKVATKLLGKGWQEISEVIGMGSSGLSSRLKDVADVKVMSPEKVKQAREFRDAMDNLKDVFEELVLTLGQQVAPKLAALADTLSKVARPMEYLSDASDILGTGFGTITDGIDNISSAYDRFFGDDPATPMASLAAASRQAGEYTDFLAGKAHAAAVALNDDADAAKRATDSTRNLRHAINDLNNIQLDGIDAKMDAFRADLAVTEQQKRLDAVLGDTEASTADQATAALDMAEATAEAARKTAILNGHTQTAAERNGGMVMTLAAIRDTLAPGSPLRVYLDQYIARLYTIPANISTNLSITGAGAGNGNRPGGGRAPTGPDGERAAPANTRSTTVVLKLGDEELKRVTVRQDKLTRGTR